jgi:hypothetical protein
VFSSLDGLQVVDRVIKTRGAFYQEKWYVPHFFTRVANRHSNYHEHDPDGNLWYICVVAADERRAFPDLAHVATVGIRTEGKKVLSWVRSCSYQKRR